MAEVKKAFRPEFINRIDDIIVFHELTEEQLGEIVVLMMRDLQKRLAERNLNIELSDAAKAWLVKTGYDPAYGARPLRRLSSSTWKPRWPTVSWPGTLPTAAPSGWIIPKPKV